MAVLCAVLRAAVSSELKTYAVRFGIVLVGLSGGGVPSSSLFPWGSSVGEDILRLLSILSQHHLGM